MKLCKISLCILFLLSLLSYSQAQTGIIVENGANVLASPGSFIVLDNGAGISNNSPETEFLGKITLKGSEPQAFQGSEPYTVQVLELSKIGSSAELFTTVSVLQEIILSGGLLVLTSGNLILEENTEISGAFSTFNMIVCDSDGMLIKQLTQTGYLFLPVGSNNGTANYSPAELTFTQGNFSDAWISVNVKDEKHPANPSTSNFISRYWTVSPVGIQDFECEVLFHYLPEDIFGEENEITSALYSNNEWTALNPAETNQISGIVNEFGDFTGADNNVLSVHNPSRSPVINADNSHIRLSAQALDSFTKLQIYDSAGRLISSQTITDSVIPHELNTGIYLIVLSGKNSQSYSSKIIITH